MKLKLGNVQFSSGFLDLELLNVLKKRLLSEVEKLAFFPENAEPILKEVPADLCFVVVFEVDYLWSFAFLVCVVRRPLARTAVTFKASEGKLLCARTVAWRHLDLLYLLMAQRLAAL